MRRAFRVDRLKPKKPNTARAVPLQRTALDALDRIPSPASATSLLFPPRRRLPRPAQLATAPLAPRATRRRHHPPRRLYDLRHTFATVALRAGLGSYELSCYMGTSLINIDRTYGHRARDSHHYAIELLDDCSCGCRVDAGGRSVDVGTIVPPTTATTEVAS